LRYAQTTKLSDPFSAKHKLLRPKRLKIKSEIKVKTTAKQDQFDQHPHCCICRLFVFSISEINKKISTE